MAWILGIDPGLDGALALMSEAGLEVWDMPTLRVAKSTAAQNREIDLTALTGILKAIDFATGGIFLAYQELVSAMPPRGQDGKPRLGGVASAFKFGGTAMATRAMLAVLGISVELVPPAKWKRDLGVPRGPDASRAAASRLLPKCAGLWMRKKDAGRADAALIAFWGSRKSGLDRIGILPKREIQLALSMQLI